MAQSPLNEVRLGLIDLRLGLDHQRCFLRVLLEHLRNRDLREQRAGLAVLRSGDRFLDIDVNFLDIAGDLRDQRRFLKRLDCRRLLDEPAHRLLLG